MKKITGYYPDDPVEYKGNDKVKKLQEIFNYNTLISGNKDNSYKIAEIKGRNTCTYCNRQYTITLKKDGEIYYPPSNLTIGS